tara:strand:- start:4161 stop:4511 length:351 start_codon:yes stop_codon:yes gene_type:complete
MGKLKYIILKNTHLTRSAHMDFGWGNGYVILPKGHIFNGVGYDILNETGKINVHYGLTFSEKYENLTDKIKALIPKDIKEGCWVVGFDTAHYRDTLERWGKREVYEEVKKLSKQLE